MGRKKGVMLSYLLMFFEVISTLLLTPFIIRSLGQAEYGVYKLTASVTAYLLLLDLGVGNAVVRYVAKFKEENNIEQERKLLGVCTIFYCSIALLSVLAGIALICMLPTAFARGLSAQEIQLSEKLMVLTIANSTITLGTAVFNYFIIGHSLFMVSKGSSIVQICFRMALTFLVLKMGMRSTGIVSVNLITTIVFRLFFVFYVFFRLKIIPVFKNLDVKFIREVVVYSSFILLQMIATQINACADQILLGMFIQGSAVIIGIYGVGAQITAYFQSIGSAFTGVLMPGVVKMVENKAVPKQLENEMVRIGRISFGILAIILSGFLVFGRQFICLWAGEENVQAYYVALLLMLAYILIYTESIGSQILWALNKHREQSILKIAIVFLNVLLTITLIRWNPLIGATIGTMISLLLGDVVVMNIIFKRKIGISLKSYYAGIFKGILPCMVLTSVFGYAFSLLELPGWFGLAIDCLAMFIVYSVLVWYFGVNNYEKYLIESAIFKIIKNR